MIESTLKAYTTVALPAIDNFLVGENIKDSYKKIWLVNTDKTFTEIFGDKVETNIPPINLQLHMLTDNIKAINAIEQLGGEKNMEIPLSQVYAFMLEAHNRDTINCSSLNSLIRDMDEHNGVGRLLVQGVSRFIFCTRHPNGSLWEISCYFSSLFPQWAVGTNQIDNDLIWNPGRRATWIVSETI